MNSGKSLLKKTIVTLTYFFMFSIASAEMYINYLNNNSEIPDTLIQDRIVFNISTKLIENVSFKDNFIVEPTGGNNKYAMSVSDFVNMKNISAKNGTIINNVTDESVEVVYGVYIKPGSSIIDSSFEGLTVNTFGGTSSLDSSSYINFAFRITGNVASPCVFNNTSLKNTNFRTVSTNYFTIFAADFKDSKISNCDFSGVKWESILSASSDLNKSRARSIFFEGNNSVVNCNFEKSIFGARIDTTSNTQESRVFGIAIECIYADGTSASSIDNSNFNASEIIVIGENTNKTTTGEVNSFGILVWGDASLTNTSFKNAKFNVSSKSAGGGGAYAIYDASYGVTYSKIHNLDFRGAEVSYDYDSQNDSWSASRLFESSDIFVENLAHCSVKNIILGTGDLYNASFEMSDRLDISQSDYSVRISSDVVLNGVTMNFFDKLASTDGACIVVDGNLILTKETIFNVYLSFEYDFSGEDVLIVQANKIQNIDFLDMRIFDSENKLIEDGSVSMFNDGTSIYLHNVPEPAIYAAIFGALALGFAAWRKRK